MRLTSAALAALFAVGLTSAHAAREQMVEAEDWLAQTKSEETRRMLTSLLEIRSRLEAASQIKTRLLLQNSEDINASATEIKGEKVIVVNLGLLEAFADDRDAIAAVYAHELAHHGKEHLSKGKSTSTALGVLGAIVGAAIDYKLGGGRIGSEATGMAANLLDLKFSRDQEREADSAGMPWLTAAGYNPNGAIRMHRLLLSKSGSEGFSILQTHPTSEERIGRLEKLIRDDPAATKLALDSKTRLYEAPPPEVAEKAEAAQNKVAKAKKVDPKLLEPVEGVSFDTYAKISSDLAFQQNPAPIYRKHHINADKYQRVSTAFAARMAGDQSFALTEHYTSRFLAASHGPYARYGQDVAQAMAGGKLKETPPMPLEQYVEIMLEFRYKGAKAGDPKVQNELLKPYQLNPYDWMLVQNWWGRRITEDAKLMQQFAHLMSEQAEGDEEDSES